MRKPLVSVIILTYKDGLSHVKKNLEAWKKVKYSSYEIILVDNNSTDNTVSYVRKHFPNVKIIENKKNLGFCGGNNQAITFAKGKYLLLLNNDAIPSPDFLNNLVDVMEKDKKIGVVQPKIRQLIDKNKLDACCSFLTLTGFLYHYGYSQEESLPAYNKRQHIYAGKGACMMTRRDLVDRIGLFDEDYFAYFEDTDFCHRAWLAGFSTVYIPTSEIFHIGGVGVEVFPLIQFHSYKNRIYTYLKNLGTRNLFRILPLHIFLCLGISLFYLLSGKFSCSAAIIKAVLWNVLNFKKTILKRRYVQTKIRKVKDSDFLPGILKKVGVSYYMHWLFSPRSYYAYKDI